jgi:hypothetical protein
VASRNSEFTPSNEPLRNRYSGGPHTRSYAIVLPGSKFATFFGGLLFARGG